MSICLLSISSAKADTGSIIPGEYVAILAIGGLAAAITLSFIITSISKLIIHYFKLPKPITFLLFYIFTIIIPPLYVWLEDAQNLLYDFEGCFGYDNKQKFHYFLIVVSIVVSQLLAYLLTSKKVETEEK